MDPVSSPLSDPPPSQLVENGALPNGRQQYRPVRQLPFELALSISDYFEEGLFTYAFGLLSSLLSSSASPSSATSPALVPRPVHLALAATIAVHPSLTSRTTSKEKWEQANAALRLLRLTFQVVGPLNAKFSEALEFKKFTRRDEDGEQEDASQERINIPIADVDSVWTRAEDFWSVVGWALNCSCLQETHGARWTRWRPWLDLMISVLETDWQIRCERGSCVDSIIIHFIENVAAGYGRDRRILRAIFADGRAQATKEFREIFKHELKAPAKTATVKKREVQVNIDQDVYGDYQAMDDDESSTEEDQRELDTRQRRSRTPSARRITPRSSASSLRSDNEANAADHASVPPLLGGPQSLLLRLRLLSLLSSVAHVIPENFLDLDDLYTFFVEFIKPLPLPAFQHIVSPSVNTAFSPDALSTLCEFILQASLESSATRLRTDTRLTQKKLEEDYLPFAASRSGTDSNVRVSLLLESLLRCLNQADLLTRTATLKEAVDRGIKSRLGKARDGRSSRGKNGSDDEAYTWLLESGQRMAAVVRGLP